MPFPIGLTLHDGFPVHIDDFIAAQAFEAEGHFSLGGVGIYNHYVCDGCFMLRNALEVAIFKYVVTDIDELAAVVGSFPSITEGTVGKLIPSVVRLWMIGHEHMVDGAGFVVNIALAIYYQSVGVFLALYAVAVGIE